MNEKFGWMHLNCDVCLHEGSRECNCPYAGQELKEEDLQKPCDQFVEVPADYEES